MARKLKHSDFVEPKILDRLVKDIEKANKKAKEFTTTVKELKKEFKSIKSIDSAKDMEKFANSVELVDKKEKELLKTKTDINKLQNKLVNGLKKEAKEQEKLKIKIAEQNKVRKQQARESLNLIGAYEKESKRLIDLRKRFKDLSVAGRGSGKVARGLAKEITALDKKLKAVDASAGQFQRNIGNYSKGVGEAAASTGIFSRQTQVLNQVLTLSRAILGKNTVATEADAVAKVANASATKKLTIVQRVMNFTFSAGTKALKLFRIALANTGVGLLILAVGSLIAFFTRAQEGIDGVSNATAGLSAGFDVLLDRFQRVGEGIIDILQGLASFDPSKIAAGFDKIKDALKGIGDELTREVNIAVQLDKLLIKLTREQKLFEAEQAASLTRVKELTILVKDKLKADNLRLAAVKEINEIEIAIAEKQLKLQAQALAGAFETLSADQKRLELTKEEIKFVDDLKNGNLDVASAAEQARNFTLGRAKAEEALFGIIDKIIEQEAARQNLLDKQSVTAKRTASITKEIANKESTALLRRSIALKELAKDERETIETRIKLLNAAAIAEIESFAVRGKANIIIEEEVAQARIQITARTEAAIRRLLEKTNEIKAGINAKEVQSVDEELQRGKIAEAKRTENLQREFELRQQLLEDRAFFRVNFEAKTAEQIELINAKLDNDLAALADEKEKREEAARKKAIDDEKAKNDAILDENLALLNAITDATSDELQKQSDLKVEALDVDIARREASLERQRIRADQGLTNSLAFEEAQLEKARLKKMEEEKKAALISEAIALGQVFLNQLAEQSKENPDTALQEALKVTFLGEAVVLGIRALAGFFEGTDDTGKGDGKVKDSKGNITGYTHEDEMVFNKKESDDFRSMGYTTRKDIMKAIQDFEQGQTWGFMPNLNMIKEERSSSQGDMSKMVKAMSEDNEKTREAIRKNKVSIIVEGNSLSEALFELVQTTIVGDNKKITRHKFEELKSHGG